MSLIFDALRQHDNQPAQEPTLSGSVVTPARWIMPWVIALLILLVGLLVVLVFQPLQSRVSVQQVEHDPVPVASVSTDSVSSEPVAGSRLSGAVLDRVVKPVGARPVQNRPNDQDAVTASASAARQNRTVLPTSPPSPPLVETPVRRVAPTIASAAVVVASEAAVQAPAQTRAVPAAPEPALAPAKVNPAELFRSFNAALAADRLEEANAVLGQTRLALGESHLMVARMQGYYCMRADCPELARQAYTRVLSRLPQDREAGYNLSVLDWQAGRKASARGRVGSMLAQYPDDESLRALQRMMERR